MKQLIIIFILFAFSASCKKNNSDNSGNIDETNKGEKWTVMSNPTDPMIATIKTDTSEINFFGERDAQGVPSKLTLFIVKLKRDTIFYEIDDLGRPLFIQSANGISFKYVWNSTGQADLTVTTQNAEHIFSAPVILVNQHNNGTPPTPNTPQGKDNLLVNVKLCGTAVTSDVGQVWVKVSTNGDIPSKFEIPANFVNGKYSATLPSSNTVSLNPLPNACNTISEILSFACKANVDGVKEALAAACALLPGWIAATGIGLPEAAGLEGFCITAAFAYNFYCKNIDELNLPDFICKATWTNRIFNETIFLEPYIIYRGAPVLGVRISTIVHDNDQVNLNLDIDNCIGTPKLTGSGWRNYDINCDGLGGVDPNNPTCSAHWPLEVDLMINNSVVTGSANFGGSASGFFWETTGTITFTTLNLNCTFKDPNSSGSDVFVLTGTGAGNNIYNGIWTRRSTDQFGGVSQTSGHFNLPLN